VHHLSLERERRITTPLRSDAAETIFAGLVLLLATSMPVDSPELDRLLRSASTEEEQAWQSFLAAYSRLLLHVARSVYSDRDEMMDAYAFILDRLQARNFARLRAFTADGRSKFSTWLVVVARRLCLDFWRERYGRSRAVASDSSRQDQRFRQRLTALTGEDVELAGIPASVTSADDQLAALELQHALAAAVDALPPADRLLLKLRFEDDLSAQQIARVLRLPSPFHVYRRLDAVTKLIRRMLEARGVENATP